MAQVSGLGRKPPAAERGEAIGFEAGGRTGVEVGVGDRHLLLEPVGLVPEEPPTEVLPG